MDIKKIREKEIKELVKMRAEVRQRYSDESLEMRMGKLKDVKKPGKTRKELAQVEFVLKEKLLVKRGLPEGKKDKLIKKQNGKAKA